MKLDGDFTPSAQAYIEACRECGVRPNTNLIQRFPAEDSKVDEWDFTRNFLGDRGLLPVIKMLKTYRGVHSLRLAHNGLRNSSVQKLVELMEDHPNLAYVDLNHNNISDSGGQALLDLFLRNRRVKTISVQHGNKFSMRMTLKLEKVFGEPVREDWVDEVFRKVYDVIFQHKYSFDEVFAAFDTNNDHVVSRDELQVGLQKLDPQLVISDEQFEAIWKASDTNEDGKVDYEEFVNRFVVIDKKGKIVHKEGQEEDWNGLMERVFLTRDTLVTSFRELDADENGTLSPEEIIEQLTALECGGPLGLSDDTKEKIVKALDTNSDGKVDYLEFIARFQVDDINKGRYPPPQQIPWCPQLSWKF